MPTVSIFLSTATMNNYNGRKKVKSGLKENLEQQTFTENGQQLTSQPFMVVGTKKPKVIHKIKTVNDTKQINGTK